MDNQENKVNTRKRTRAGAHAHSTNAVKRRSPLRPILTFVIIVLGVLLALLLVLVLLSRIAPGLLDPLLYSKEELQILRYQ